MIDACAEVRSPLHRGADPFGKHRRCALHAVAEAGAADLRLALDGAAEHRHRVRVVEEDGVGADLLHVPADIQHDRDGAQSAEDAGGAAGVAHVEVDPVLLRDLDVVAPHRDGCRKDGAEDGIRALKGFAAVERRLDLGRIVALVHDPLHGGLRELKALFVDIHQAQRGA